MKIIAMTAFLLIAGLLTNPAVAQESTRLQCEFENGRFKIRKGIDSWSQYVGPYDDAIVKCDRDTAAALIGPYAYYFKDGEFEYIFVGSHDDRQLSLKKDLAVAVMGPYVIVNPGDEFEVHFVGNSSQPAKIISTNRIAAVLTDNYVIAYMNDKIHLKFVGQRALSDYRARGNIIGISHGAYFAVVDGTRSEVNDRFIGVSGRITIVRDEVHHVTEQGRITVYDIESGSFR